MKELVLQDVKKQLQLLMKKVDEDKKEFDQRAKKLLETLRALD